MNVSLDILLYKQKISIEKDTSIHNYMLTQARHFVIVFFFLRKESYLT